MWAYTEAGAGEGTSAVEAVQAWRDVRFAPRVLRDVSRADTAARMLGADLGTPVGVAPTALQRAAHPHGEVAMARGAAAAGALHVVSSNAGHRFAEIDAGAPWWVQAYLPPTRDDALPMLTAAAEAGARAVVLTVDTPFPGPKELPPDTDWAEVDLSWFRCNFAVPGDVRWAADLVPDDIGWLRRALGLPVVAKGVLRPDDARVCVEAGAAAVWVSNHGGRQLDRAVSTSAALPAVVAAVADDAEVYVDGGIRSGLDALAALALGADGVFVGRLPLHALAAGGAEEVAAVLGRLTAELRDALRLAGCCRPGEAPGILADPGAASR
jgi:4-hydroxymandelate oxidase